MEKTLEQKVQDAYDDYISYWFTVAKVTGNPQDMRILIDFANIYYKLKEELDRSLGEERE